MQPGTRCDRMDAGKRPEKEIRGRDTAAFYFLLFILLLVVGFLCFRHDMLCLLLSSLS